MNRAKVSNQKTRVAALKIASQFGTQDSINRNVKTISVIVNQAADDGAKIVVMPETAITGYASQDMSTIWQVPSYPKSQDFKGLDPTPYTIEIDRKPDSPLPGPLNAFKKLAEERGIYIIATFLEKECQQTKYGDFVFYSSSMLFSPTNGMVGHYRKMNPWMPVDQHFMTAGNSLVTYDTEYGRISFCVCFDIRACLPLIKKHNVWAHFHSFAWVDAVKGKPTLTKQVKESITQKGILGEEWSGNWFKAGLPGMIFENGGGFYVVAANWSVDEPQDWTGFGYESIYSPEGIILCQDDTPLGNGYVTWDLNPPAENPPPPFPLYE